MKYEHNKVYLQVEPHGHDGEDDGGVDKVREGDGEDERSSCLDEMGRENLKIVLHQIKGWFIWLGLGPKVNRNENFPTFLLVIG